MWFNSSNEYMKEFTNSYNSDLVGALLPYTNSSLGISASIAHSLRITGYISFARSVLIKLIVNNNMINRTVGTPST